MARLFVNVDHVATVRQARRGSSPDPVELALEAEAAGADGITMHLREDRRHVQDHDVRRMVAAGRTPFNFELAAAEDVVRLCEELRPPQATLVPERRAEITTEGGLELGRPHRPLLDVIARLRARGILVSLFIAPDQEAVRACAASGAELVELHTGRYAHADATQRPLALRELEEAAALARELGLGVNAGHGLDYDNVGPVARIPGMLDLNIGHAIVARALSVGLGTAVAEMRRCIAGS